jgi:hypothetical protein
MGSYRHSKRLGTAGVHTCRPVSEPRNTAVRIHLGLHHASVSCGKGESFWPTLLPCLFVTDSDALSKPIGPQLSTIIQLTKNLWCVIRLSPAVVNDSRLLPDSTMIWTTSCRRSICAHSTRRKAGTAPGDPPERLRHGQCTRPWRAAGRRERGQALPPQLIEGHVARTAAPAAATAVDGDAGHRGLDIDGGGAGSLADLAGSGQAESTHSAPLSTRVGVARTRGSRAGSEPGALVPQVAS